jgi:TPR repeat protein
MKSTSTYLELRPIEDQLFNAPVSECFLASLQESSIDNGDITELMYRYHLSVKDYPNAIHFLELADTFNDSYAQLCLASLYQRGIHCIKDQKRALGLFEKAAKNGESEAQYELALNLLFKANRAEDEDVKQGIYWLNESLLNGNEDSAIMLATLSS